MDRQQSIKEVLACLGDDYALLLGTANQDLANEASTLYQSWPFGQIVTTADWAKTNMQDFLKDPAVVGTDKALRLKQALAPSLIRQFASTVAKGGWVAASINQDVDQALISLIEQMPETDMPSYWLFDKVPGQNIIELIKRKNTVMISVPSIVDWLKSSNSFISDSQIGSSSAVLTKHSASLNRGTEEGPEVRILAIDGGGIRGIVPAVILEALETQSGKSISELFDVIAGTSTGGILALGLSAPRAPHSKDAKHSAAALADLYVSEGPRIFPKHPSRVPRFWQLMAGPLLWSRFKMLRSLGELLHTVFAKPYPDDGIETVLKKYFSYDNGESIPLSDALKEVLVTSYDMQSRTIELMTKERSVVPTSNYLMRDAARATSAAPSFFRPLVLGTRVIDQKTLIDGGLFANNPAACACVHAQRLFPLCQLRILSIGTGTNFAPIDATALRDWNTGQWAPQLISCMFDAGSECVDQNLSRLIPRDKNNVRRYIRLQVNLGNVPDSIDDSDNVQALANRTRQALAQELKTDFDDVLSWFSTAQINH
jgi:predicted acylesterase/phospholipase RssA